LSCSELNLRLPHEYNDNLIIDNTNLAEKYLRRFARLKKLSNESEHTFFIRQVSVAIHDQPAETEQEYEKNTSNLVENVKKFLGHDKFTIILMSQNNFFNSFNDISSNVVTLNNIHSLSGGYQEAEKINDWDHPFFKKYKRFFTALESKLNNSDVENIYNEIFRL